MLLKNEVPYSLPFSNQEGVDGIFSFKLPISLPEIKELFVFFSRVALLAILQRQLLLRRGAMSGKV